MLAILWRYQQPAGGGGASSGSSSGARWAGLGHDERWRFRLDRLDQRDAVLEPEPTPEPPAEVPEDESEDVLAPVVVRAPRLRRIGTPTPAPVVRELAPMSEATAARFMAALDAMDDRLRDAEQRAAQAERDRRTAARQARAAAEWAAIEQARMAAEDDEMMQVLLLVHDAVDDF
jgi:hypothetical protein